MPARAWAWLCRLDPDVRVFALGYLVLLPFYLAPLFVTRFLPGLDLPFHLSIADMLMKAGDPASPYAGYYEPRLGLAPYMTHYLLLVGLGRFVDLATAHVVVMQLYVASLPLAVARFLSVCGRSRVPALLAFPLTYNLAVHYGFISFCLSLPALFLWLALVVAFLHEAAGQTHRLWWGGGAAAAAGVLLFACHLQNFLYGVCAVLVLIVCSRVGPRPRVLALLSMVPSLGALWFWLVNSGHGPTSQGMGERLTFAWQAFKAARMADLRWGQVPLAEDLRQRLAWLPEQMLKGFSDQSDIVAARAFLVAVAAYGLVGWVAAVLVPPSQPVIEARADSALGADPGARLPVRPRLPIASWVLLGGAALAFFALPHHLPVFELMTFYPRFSVLVALFLLPILPTALRRIQGPLRVALVLPALFVGLFHARTVYAQYRAYRAELSDFVRVLGATPPGGKLVSLIYDRRSRVLRTESPMVGLAGFYVALRYVPTAMVPLAYCGMRHIPCALREGVPRVPFPGPWIDQPVDLDAMLAAFDYFLVRAPPPDYLLTPRSDRLEILAHSGTWWLVGKRSPAPVDDTDAPAAVAPDRPAD